MERWRKRLKMTRNRLDDRQKMPKNQGAAKYDKKQSTTRCEMQRKASTKEKDNEKQTKEMYQRNSNRSEKQNMQERRNAVKSFDQTKRKREAETSKECKKGEMQRDSNSRRMGGKYFMIMASDGIPLCCVTASKAPMVCCNAFSSWSTRKRFAPCRLSCNAAWRPISPPAPVMKICIGFALASPWHCHSAESDADLNGKSVLSVLMGDSGNKKYFESARTAHACPLGQHVRTVYDWPRRSALCLFQQVERISITRVLLKFWYLAAEAHVSFKLRSTLARCSPIFWECTCTCPHVRKKPCALVYSYRLSTEALVSLKLRHTLMECISLFHKLPCKGSHQVSQLPKFLLKSCYPCCFMVKFALM